MKPCFGGVLLGLAAILGCTTPQPQTVLPPPHALPAQTAFPDPLVMLDGRRVTSQAQWYSERRPELKRLFQHYMYGPIPPAPAAVRALHLGDHPDFLGGKATLKLRRLETGPQGAPSIDLMLVIPNARGGPAPLFLSMNFCGNHALTTDPRVPLGRGWMGRNCAGSVDNIATDAARGTQVNDWPLDKIITRGYALAAFHSADVDADRAQLSTGLYAWLAAGAAHEVAAPTHNPTNRGAIAAWAWGFHRCVDYLVTDRDVDPRRIAAIGHSRNGKTALLAAAFDDRIAVAFPHQAGTGGSAPSRSTTGESLKAINDRFPHWFNGNFKHFNDDPARLPFDQHCLVALCAPRPVLFTAAEGDQWANPDGQFQILLAADPVYRFLKVDGLDMKQKPPVGKLLDSHLGYFTRNGSHQMAPEDWDVFLAFADCHLKNGA